MRIISDYAEVRTLTSTALRKRAITNCPIIHANELAAEIALGTLRLQEWEGGVMLARRRQGFDLISLFIFDRTVPIPAPTLDGICEIVFDPRGKSGADVLEQMLLSCGFLPALRRMRLTSEIAADASPTYNIVTLGIEQYAAVSSFLEISFDPCLGCIPTLRALSKDLSSGCFHAISDETGILSLIHVKDNEIRHLATRADQRGRGFAQVLVRFASHNRTEKRMQVWCAEDNFAAQKTYRSCGFTPDGYSSLVLRYSANAAIKQPTLIHI